MNGRDLAQGADGRSETAGAEDEGVEEELDGDKSHLEFPDDAANLMALEAAKERQGKFQGVGLGIIG